MQRIMSLIRRILYVWHTKLAVSVVGVVDERVWR
jgi:hypothetical protein